MNMIDIINCEFFRVQVVLTKNYFRYNWYKSFHFQELLFDFSTEEIVLLSMV